MKLFRHELRKIIGKRYLITLLILFCVVNILYVYNLNHESAEEKRFSVGVKKIMEMAEGEMTSERIEFVMEHYRKTEEVVATGNYDTVTPSDEFYTGFVFGDYMAFMDIRAQMEAIYLYNDRITDLRSFAADNEVFFERYGNGYEARKNAMISNIYGSRHIREYYDTKGFSRLFRYDFSSLLLMLLVVAGLVPVFAGERETDTELYLLTSRYGTGVTVKNKLLASALFIASLWLLFTAVDFASFAGFSGLRGAHCPLYIMPDYRNTPLTVTVWQFALISAGLRLLGLYLLGGAVLLFSSLFSDTLLPSLCGFGIIVAAIFLYNSAESSAGLGWLWNPVAILMSRTWFQSFTAFNLFGYPVLYYPVGIAAAAVLTALFATLSALLVRRRIGFNGRVTSRIKEAVS